MSLKRFLATAAFAVLVAAVPVTADKDGPIGLGLAAASCTEEGCGSISKVDCICPDIQMRNRLPRCIDPAP